MNPNDKNLGSQGFSSGGSSGSMRYGARDLDAESTGYSPSPSELDASSTSYGSRGVEAQDADEVILQETYVTQPEIDVESLDLSSVDLDSGFNLRWLLWGGLSVGAGLLAYSLARKNKLMLRDRLSSVAGFAKERISGFRSEWSSDSADSYVLQENPRPDMVDESIVSNYSSETPSYLSSAEAIRPEQTSFGGSSSSFGSASSFGGSSASFGSSGIGSSGVSSGLESSPGIGSGLGSSSLDASSESSSSFEKDPDSVAASPARR